MPVDPNLCIHAGPQVDQSNVQMFAFTGGSIHSHKHSKALVSEYRKGDSGPTPKDLLEVMTKAAKHAVSLNKKRFEDENFDLDLTYITPRVIAMGFPSRGVEGKYRNSEDDVYKFFQQRHAGHYRIINLCSERGYRLDLFHGSVARYPFPDHNPPPMELSN